MTGSLMTTTSPDYAEILRLHRKYRAYEGEPLWKVFVRVGQELEGSTKKQRCPSCFYTDQGYDRLVEPHCCDPWHADAHLRSSSLSRPTALTH
jgi:hypothetical protein